MERTSVTKGCRFPSECLHSQSLVSKGSYWDFLSLGSRCGVVPGENTCFRDLSVVMFFTMQSTHQAFQPNQEVLGRVPYRGAMCR